MQLKINNFRSFKDTGFVDIKPITILLGKNSSGKSSFLRTFPMLKQSVEERTKSPLLLYGHFVDFGNSADITPTFAEEGDNYQLSFILDSKMSLMRPFVSRRVNRNLRRMFEFETEYSVEFTEDKKELLHISVMKIDFLSNSVQFVLNTEKSKVHEISVNNEIIFDSTDDIFYLDQGDFVVDFFSNVVRKMRVDDNRVEKIVRRLPAVRNIRPKIITLVSRFVHGRTEYPTKWRIIENISIGSDDEMLEQMKNVKYPLSWSKNISSWTVENKTFQQLKNYIIVHSMFDYFLKKINEYLKATFSEIKYIAPLRATAERFYRIQQLAVNEVDPNGKNLPIFLDSLTVAQMKDFEGWTLDNFEFKVKIHKTEGHYSIKVILKDGNEINLSDMGFGYSQILPIITQLWYSSSLFANDRFRSMRRGTLFPKILAIEQPELHLHPGFQAKFADVLVKVISYSKSIGVDLRLVIETHSDTIVNRLGDCVLNNEIETDQINIVIFDKPSEKLPTSISFSSFDIDGCLTNWPLGFFQPKMK